MRGLTKGGMFHSGAIIAIGRATGIIFAFCLNLLLARILSKEDFGRINFIFCVVAVFVAIAKFGMDRLLLKIISEARGQMRPDQMRTLLRNSALINAPAALVAFLAIALLMPLFPAIENLQNRETIILLTGLCVAGTTYLQLTTECFRGMNEIVKCTIYDGQRSGPAISILFTAGLFGVAILSQGGQETTLGVVLAIYIAVQCIVVVLASLSFYKTALNINCSVMAPAHSATETSVSFHYLLFASYPIAISETFGVLASFGDMWVASFALSITELANWTVASQLTQLTSIPLTVINLTIISQIPKLHRDGKLGELQTVLQASATMATAVCLLPMAAFIFLPRWLVCTTFGNEYSDAAAAVAVISVGKLIFVWTGPCGYTLLLTGFQRIVMTSNVLSFFAIAIGGYAAAKAYGLTGLAVATSAITITLNLYLWIMARRHSQVWTHCSVRYVCFKLWPRKCVGK